MIKIDEIQQTLALEVQEEQPTSNRTVVHKRPSAGWEMKIRQGTQLTVMSRGIRKKQTRAEIQRAKRHPHIFTF